MNEEMIPVSIEDSIRFKCAPGNSCFNECCRDLNQFLTPYDILRLKQNLKLSSDEFLDTYTVTHIGPETGLPVITLKTNHADGYVCPFVSANGCKVYEDRPSSCRIYPLARAVTRSRQNGELTEHYALIKEAHCKGFKGEQAMTVREWVIDQALEPYNKMNDKMMEIISLKNIMLPGSLASEQLENFYMACYNLDIFRDRMFHAGLLSDIEIPAGVLEKVKTDDQSLLELSFDWIKYALFNRKMTVQEIAHENKR